MEKFYEFIHNLKLFLLGILDMEQFYNILFFEETSKSGKEVQRVSLFFIWDMINGTGES